jgi:hypothetical protein
MIQILSGATTMPARREAEQVFLPRALFDHIGGSARFKLFCGPLLW